MLVGKYESNATALRLALQYRLGTRRPRVRMCAGGGGRGWGGRVWRVNLEMCLR